jgi:hypothetical protein
MNRKQRACALAGLSLLVLSLLFVPTHPYPSPLIRYSFLFTGQGSIDFARLFIEGVLIALVTGGIFYAVRGPDSLKRETRIPKAKTTIGRAWRHLFSLSIVLVIAALCVTNYLSLRKIRRLEGGTQNVKQMVLTTLDTVHKENMSLISLYDTSPVDFVQDPTQGRVWSPGDMSQVDTLRHPTLGVLSFPRNMPLEERFRLIDRAVLAQEPLRRIKEALDKLQ